MKVRCTLLLLLLLSGTTFAQLPLMSQSPDPPLAKTGILCEPDGYALAILHIFSAEAVIVPPDTITCLQEEIVLDGSGSTADQYAWFNPSGLVFSSDSVTTVSDTGLFMLVVTRVVLGIMYHDTATVLVSGNLQPPQVTAFGDTITCLRPVVPIGGTSSIPGTTFAWAGSNGFFAIIPDTSATIPGTYVLTGTAPNGCARQDTLWIVSNTAYPTVSVMLPDTLTCARDSVFLQATVNPPGTSLAWSGPHNFSADADMVTVFEPGNYTLLSITPSGCADTSAVSVFADTVAPQALASGGTISCVQPSVGLSGIATPAGSAMTWAGPGGFSANLPDTATNLPGLYLLTATAPNGCTHTDSLLINADTVAPWILVPGADTLTCVLDTVLVTANLTPAGSSVVWAGPLNFSSTDTGAALVTPGLYTLTATAANGCTASAAVNIATDTLPPPLSAIGDTLRCNYQTGIVQANTSAGATLLWAGPQSFSSTADAPLVTTPGAYMVVATAPNGCTAHTTVAVATDTIAPQLSASGGLLTCLQPQLSLAATVSPANADLLWTGPENFTSTVLQPVVSLGGTYTLLATTPNGCTGTAVATVTTDTAPPQVSVSGGTLSCSQPALTLMPVFSPSGSSVAWSGPQNFSSTLPNPTVNLGGMYTITVTTGAGCTATSQAMILHDTIPPVVTAGGGTLTCSQPLVSLSANVAPPGSPVSWQGPNGFSATVLNPAATAAGLYQITATAHNGCKGTATATVAADTVAPHLSATGGTLSCLQTSILLGSTVIPANSTLLWEGPQQFSSSLPNPAVNLPGMYALAATAPNGCTATAAAMVVADTGLPQVTTGGGTITCTQTQVALSANVMPSGNTLLWSGPQGFSSTQPNPTVNLAGIYTLTATLPNGCSNSTTATVTADTTRPAVTAIGGDLTCLAETILLEADFEPDDCQIAWSGPSGFFSAQPMPAVALEGNYEVTVTAPNGCTAVAQAGVTAHNQPAWALDLGPDLMVEENGWVFLQPETDLPIGQMAGVWWTYPPGVLGSPCDTCLKTAFKINETGILSLQITDMFGCSQTASVLIRVRKGIYAPNVFAPESGTANALFALFPGPESQVVRIRSFRIFDRWGNLLHERTGVGVNPEEYGWDGFARGQKCVPGVYVWYAEIEFESGNVEVLKGDVTLVR